MSDPATRPAALLAAAALIGPAIPPSMVVNRPHEAATALTRMADLLLPWLEAEQLLASPGTTLLRLPKREPGTPETGGKNDGGNEGPSPETQ